MSITSALQERAENFIKPKEPEKPKEIVDEYDLLMAKFERDLGKFPFQALWPQAQEGSLIKIVVIINVVISLVVMITIFAK